MRPEEFAQEVVNAYEEGRGVFSNRVNAEDLVPQKASDLEKARFLFYVTQLDYATRSQRLYAGAKQFFEEQGSSAFNPHQILDLSERELTKRLEKYIRPRYINEAVRRWKVNSQVLTQKYDGDPRLIFKKSESAGEVLEKVGEFRGFGPKIGNFFVRTMINTFGYKFKDIEEILPPVDTWDVKVAYLLGYLDSAEMSSRNVIKAKEFWSNACRASGVSWLIFDKALWLLGSEGKPKTKSDIETLLSVV